MKSTEEFRITAKVENSGSIPVSNLFAKLMVVSQKDSIEIIGDAIQPVGTLSADDGVYGSGEDSAEVVWSVKYTGDLTDESIMLKVDLVESDGEPVSFEGFEDRQFLMVDPLVTDTDLDGMLDEYEKVNSLDTGKDDSHEDKDGDGLTNIREFRLGTDAGKKDTDNDGLSDGEESRGGDDGFITDPLNADTDGDGVDDKKDGAPNDPNSTEVGERPLEPVVSVDKRVVTLTPEEPVAVVMVSNAGDGDLYWTAASLNDALAITVPDVAEVNMSQLLIISVPPGFIFEAQDTAETIVRVVDAFGLDTDFVEITVRVGRSP